MMNLERLREALGDYQVVLEPDRDEAEWWAGAPTAAEGPDGAVYLAARMRNPHTPRGERGYALRLLRNDDGVRFQPVKDLPREAAGVPGFERAALVRDPESNAFVLYCSANLGDGWGILRLEPQPDPARLDMATAQLVLREPPVPDGFARVNGYKDPFVMHSGGQWHMFVIGCDVVERVHHFVSGDGIAWRRGCEAPLLGNTGWHSFYTRPACLLPMPVGWLFVYEGSHFAWRDPVYNIATGLAYTPDLIHYTDLTPDAPLLKSTTPGDYHTWRYSHWLRRGNRVLVYFEASRPNNSNELRVASFPC